MSQHLVRGLVARSREISRYPRVSPGHVNECRCAFVRSPPPFVNFGTKLMPSRAAHAMLDSPSEDRGLRNALLGQDDARRRLPAASPRVRARAGALRVAHG